LCSVAVLMHTGLYSYRDLADNWSINIATELEDYLEELETIQISLDGGKTNLNFAEAALVIQVLDFRPGVHTDSLNCFGGERHA
jgi:hypothetical protein